MTYDKRRPAPSRMPPARQEPLDVPFFGKIALARGYVTEAELREVLEFQRRLRREGRERPLGTLLVERGLLKPAQVQAILGSQDKRQARCGKCRKVFTVKGGIEAPLPKCPKCAGPLTEIADPGPGELTGSLLTTDSGSRTPVQAPAGGPPASPAEGPTVRVQASPATGAPASGMGGRGGLPKGFTESYARPGGPGREPEIGEVVGGCEVIRKIGKGGMGSVFEAKHIGLNKRVALKILAPSLTANSEIVRRFLQEARAAAKLDHPNIVQVLNVGRDAHHHFIVMQFVEGRSLSAVVEEKGALEPRRASEIVRDVARGLAAAHRQGVIHRDVKPGNIMISGDGSAKIADFGLAKETSGEGDISRAGQILGSPHYMSPEQGDGKKVDHRSDIYSLGITFYYCLSGQKPFTGATPIAIIMKHLYDPPPPLREIAPGVPVEHESVAMRMMEKDPENRYLTCEEVLEDLERLLRGEAPAAVRAAPRRRPRRALRVAAAAALLLAAAGGGAALAYPDEARRLWTEARDRLFGDPALERQADGAWDDAERAARERPGEPEKAAGLFEK
ncbi:MAG: serine/threonine protein kinase, partial [Planctomycetales bacterium]|nr:serine/threonine protein kinase [Planctomycetales bacterium]